MTSALVEHVDRFVAPSSAGASGIYLAASSLASSRAPFFQGFLKSPRRSADLALTLARVIGTRFYTPPGMLQKLLRERDPVITCGGGLLRLEGFSACCGVYARLDLLPTSFEAERLEAGTSNVDFNPPMRAALARLRDGERAQLEVSATGFTLTSETSAPAFEKRVELPVRWVKGFVEVQAHQSRMEHKFEISGAMVGRFLRDLPRRSSPGPVWLTPQGNSLRLSRAATGGGVLAGGIERLRILAEVARHAESISVYASGDGATAWRMETANSRLFFVLSPEPSRGFSGEGQVLVSLAEGSSVTSRVRGLMRWQRDLIPAALAQELQTSQAEVAAALAELGTCGLVGYDLAEGAYFHRELPFDVSRISGFHPRLKDARELFASGAVELNEAGAWVRGSGGDYHLRRTPAGEFRCTCPWASRHGTSRGPCKHILAANIAQGNNGDDE